MIFGLFYFCVVILCVNRSRSSFILYRIVKRHSRQSNVRRIWTCADNEKGHLVMFEVMGPIWTSFNPNETWHTHCGMTSLHRSDNGVLAQELVSGQQTSNY